MRREPVLLTSLAGLIVTLAASYGLELERDGVIATIVLVQSIVAAVARARVSPD